MLRIAFMKWSLPAETTAAKNGPKELECPPKNSSWLTKL